MEYAQYVLNQLSEKEKELLKDIYRVGVFTREERLDIEFASSLMNIDYRLDNFSFDPKLMEEKLELLEIIDEKDYLIKKCQQTLFNWNLILTEDNKFYYFTKCRLTSIGFKVCQLY